MVDKNLELIRQCEYAYTEPYGNSQHTVWAEFIKGFNDVKPCTFHSEPSQQALEDFLSENGFIVYSWSDDWTSYRNLKWVRKIVVWKTLPVGSDVDFYLHLEADTPWFNVVYGHVSPEDMGKRLLRLGYDLIDEAHEWAEYRKD